MKQNIITKTWNYLTAPNASITDIEQRRQSKLLASLIVALLGTTIIAGILLSAQAGYVPPTVLFLLPGQLVSLLMFILNRSGRYRASAWIFVAVNFLLIYARAVTSGDITWLLFAQMPILFSAILLSRRVTVGLFLTSLAILIGLRFANLPSVTISALAPIIVLGILGSLVLVFVSHRTNLEVERRAELQAANTLLEESSAKLAALNDQLEHRVAERTKELEEARDRAERADQIKSQFLASMSHELRTPLNAILNFTEMISLEMVGPVSEPQKDLLGKSLGSARHLLSLINDVLDVSKMQSGMLSLFLEDNIDLNKEVDAVIVTAESLLNGKPITLALDIDADLPRIRGDSRRIRQILLNLISNAAKFTEEGTITLSAKQRSGEALFAVIDTGPGITLDEQKTIFEPFVQTESGIKHSGGTGLGLSISKHLAEAHGGKLWLESQPGDGAAFYVSLPIGAPEPVKA